MLNKPTKTKAVFLDRDGTINIEVDLLRRLDQLRILPGAARAIKRLNRLGFLVVVITNQAVVARGWMTEKEVDEVHAVLIQRLNKRGAKIDAVYSCPHHPNANLKKYRILCKCRKPNIGMIMRAVKRFNIDRKKSFMIGDATRDILAGKRAKLKTILVRTGHAGLDGNYVVHADYEAKNLGEAVNIIKKTAGRHADLL